jgi:hypothetical protein
MRDLYTRHASTLPANIQHAIAELFGRDALDSRVCDLMTLSEWQDFAREHVTPTRVSFDGQDSPPFLAYVEADTWNGFEVAWVTLADLLAVTLDGGVTLFDSALTYVEGEGVYEVSDVQTVPLDSRVINGETYYRMDGFTVTRVQA